MVWNVLRKKLLSDILFKEKKLPIITFKRWWKCVIYWGHPCDDKRYVQMIVIARQLSYPLSFHRRANRFNSENIKWKMKIIGKMIHVHWTTKSSYYSEHRVLMISQDTKKPMIINFALFDPELPQCDIQQLAPPHH